MDLTQIKTIAIIGLSDKPDRSSYQVAQYLINQGYKIIPVNPNIQQFFDQKSYPDISSVPPEINLDIVDIFRKSEEVLSVIQEIINTGRRPIIWLQEGIDNTEAVNLAKSHGFEITSGICLMKFHQQTFRQ
ncbi:MAG: CoA-binding protein [Candidatus Shapirobacteria bacterium]|nr:CoA-binding protein [Candidatus Shapirobacteria bacterium]